MSCISNKSTRWWTRLSIQLFLLQSPLSISLSLAIHHQSSQNASQPMDMEDLCRTRVLSPSLWQELDMNHYLKNYPSGAHLSLYEYADQVGATNFNCEVGSTCDPSELCAGVKGKDWYALVAAQRWNRITNMLYTAISDSVSMASDTLPMMVMDLIPDASPSWNRAANIINVAVATISSIPGIVFGNDQVEVLWTMMIGILYVSGGWAWTEAILLVHNPPKYELWEDTLFSLRKYEERMQGNLTSFTNQVIRSGISTKQGLYGINQDGNLFSRFQIDSAQEMKEVLIDDLRLRALSLIFRYQRAFIIRGAEPCIHDGPDGAFSGKNIIAMCDKDQIMMVVAVPKHNRFTIKLRNAYLLNRKYGITNEDIFKNAWYCHEKYGPLGHSFTFNMTMPFHYQPECMLNLPICDFTVPSIREKRKSGKSLIVICREAGKLPI